MSNQIDDANKTKTIPVPVETNLKSTALLINITCGKCQHFNRIPYPQYGTVCSTLGVVEKAKPCKRFSPDSKQVQFSTDTDLVQFATFLASVPNSKLGIIASLLTREHRTRSQGFVFGEVVYLKVFEGDYISNYRRCRVVQADSKYIHIEGKSGFTASVLKQSVLNHKQWKKKRLALEESKLIKDPKYKSYFIAPTPASKKISQILESIEPPMLDGTTISPKKKNAIVVTEGSSTKLKKKVRVLYTKKINNARTAELDTLLRIRS